ncbi:MAG TPA: LysE family translocator [Kiloniellaceae bacterium]|nr:LysE family translocator [Kiloniellaceae bacterium]HIP77813.1 LysE family translocator [Kiloniellaceae bacterium]
MDANLILALAGFAFVTSVTPGPGNFLLLASGVNFGFRRSLPLVLGISFGFLFMVLVIGLGLGPVLQRYPLAAAVLRIACLGYVFWLAWRIFRSAPATDDPERAAGRPLRFLQAALLQWLNPKAWAVALIVTVSYTASGGSTSDYVASLVSVILLFGVVNLPSISLWAVSGVALRRLLDDPLRLRRFNAAMAVLLVLSMVPVILDVSIF